MSCQQVPTAPAFNPYPRSVQVGEFEVAIGGGIWVAIGEHRARAPTRVPFILTFVDGLTTGEDEQGHCQEQST